MNPININRVHLRGIDIDTVAMRLQHFVRVGPPKIELSVV